MSLPIEPWSILRALRASPPGRAETDEARRAVFTAALEQAEQFLAAAGSVGFATRPVQLFYALNQAGRAIAAARAEEPWEIQSHGARAKTRDDVAATTVEPDGSARGAIGIVARATGSELWDGSVTLGALWASLPELPHDSGLVGSAHVPFEIDQADSDYSAWMPQTVQVNTLLTSSWYGSYASGLTWRVGLRLKDPPSGLDEQRRLVERLLAPYPRAAGWAIAEGMALTNTYDPRPAPIFVEWAQTDEDGKRVVRAVETLTEHYDGHLYFRPALGRNRAVPSSLITWWGLLLALASLARYESVAWRRALGIDDSSTAWALERGLTIAQRRIPELVLRAVTGE